MKTNCATHLADRQDKWLSPLVGVIELFAVDEGGDVVEVDLVIGSHDLVPRAVAITDRLDAQVLVELLQRDVEDEYGIRRNHAAAGTWKQCEKLFCCGFVDTHIT